MSEVEKVDIMSQPTHTPVLLTETLDYLRPASTGRFIDATFGGGGHTTAILEASAPDGRLLALDADPQAIERATRLQESYPGRLIVQPGNFSQIERLATTHSFAPVDGILMDLGVSSFQLDDPSRGFSFRAAGPLDMRFDPELGFDAATIVNTWPETELANLIFEYGEETQSRRIARAIAHDRQTEPFTSTEQLAGLIERVVGRRGQRMIHPATKTFQALRIAVNQELDSLRTGLAGAINLLAPGGRLVVISFHSLEDRIVKTYFRREARGCICPPGTPVCVCGHTARVRVLTSKPVRPGEAEQQQNPRSRSALLRVAERLP